MEKSLTKQRPGPKKFIIGAVICVLLIGVSVGVYYGAVGNNESGSMSSGGGNSPTSAGPSPTNDDPVDDNSESSSNTQVGCIKTPVEASTPKFQYQSIQIIKDVNYGKGVVNKGEIELLLDVYHPPNQDKKYPLMIHIHGGSFTSGSKSDGYMRSASEFWAQHGFVVASIDYRLAGDSPVVSREMEPVYEYVVENLNEVLKSDQQAQAATCAVEDTLAAYNYLKNLEYVNGDVVVMNGYSAGAITALWATYGVDNFNIDRPPVKAVLSHWGLLVMDQDETNAMVPKKNEPPAFLVHATGDSVVPYDGTQYLANRQHSINMPFVLHCEESGSHAIEIEKTTHTGDMSILDAELAWIESILY